MLIETHAHLDSPRFDQDRAEIVARATRHGVVQMVTVGTDLVSSRACIALTEQYTGLFATVGVHPHASGELSDRAYAELATLARHPKVVAVGEIGLDYYRDYAPHEVQRLAFERQLTLALDTGKPVVVHIRDRGGAVSAYEDVLHYLADWVTARDAQSPPGVLHCFSGDLEDAQRGLELGFYLGVDGPVTYPNADSLRALVMQVPLERLLLETDCPYLAPQARRGKRNEPAYLPYIAQEVARIHGIPLSSAAEQTTANARSLLGIPVPHPVDESD
jgi:TatD DNase family protein